MVSHGRIYGLLGIEGSWVQLRSLLWTANLGCIGGVSSEWRALGVSADNRGAQAVCCGQQGSPGGVAVDGTPMRITSVVGGFPSSQTFLEVKMLETAMAIENGADEVDVVMNVGKVLTGALDEAANEIEVLREEARDVVLKVILETGALKTPEMIRRASLLAMLAGADFIKTSTGKIDVAATPEAAVVMCLAIRDYYERTGRKVGFKAAGGVRTAEEAALYYTIVEEILGAEWLTTDLFRIGASSAANNILSAIEGHPVKYY